jgi:hypothetical protein
MSPTTLLLLQSMLITLQTINAALGTIVQNPAISLVIGAVIGGFQYFVQNIGNKTVPPPMAQPK